MQANFFAGFFPMNLPFMRTSNLSIRGLVICWFSSRVVPIENVHKAGDPEDVAHMSYYITSLECACS